MSSGARFSETIACVSLWQPWAQLVVTGEKRYETRSWSTTYRGSLLIHASKTDKGWKIANETVKTLATVSPALPGVLSRIRERSELPHGAIIGQVELVDVFEMPDPVRVDGEITRLQIALGDWRPGRFAWKLEEPRLFTEPVPYRGRQGLFSVNVDAVPGIQGG